MPELDTEALDPDLMRLRDAIDLKLAAKGMLNTSIEGQMTLHAGGPRATLAIRIGKPWPPLGVLQEAKEEILALFEGGRVDLVLDEDLVAE